MYIVAEITGKMNTEPLYASDIFDSLITQENGLSFSDNQIVARYDTLKEAHDVLKEYRSEAYQKSCFFNDVWEVSLYTIIKRTKYDSGYFDDEYVDYAPLEKS